MNAVMNDNMIIKLTSQQKIKSITIFEEGGGMELLNIIHLHF